MKRLVVCCDGTWNTAGQKFPTNVKRLYAALSDTGADGVRQEGCYVQGVGTKPRERILGGAFGWGLSANIKDAYRFVVEHFEPGDELFLLGFSRGAYTARSTAGFIRNAGILTEKHRGRIDEAYDLYRDRGKHPREDVATEFRAKYSHETRIRFIGVWDTVGSLGIPLTGLHLAKWLNRRWQFHDTDLSSWVDAAFHAVAIDERRRPFVPTMWKQRQGAAAQTVEQVWFSGVHSDVGGGYADHELADIALLWMADRAESCGLAFRKGALDPPAVAPRADGRMHNSRKDLYLLFRPAERKLGQPDVVNELVASSAIARLDGDPSYAPNLRAYRQSSACKETPVRLA
jgi:uncharacterized protein (DUF2235 family)